MKKSMNGESYLLLPFEQNPFPFRALLVDPYTIVRTQVTACNRCTGVSDIPGRGNILGGETRPRMFYYILNQPFYAKIIQKFLYSKF